MSTASGGGGASVALWTGLEWGFGLTSEDGRLFVGYGLCSGKVPARTRRTEIERLTARMGRSWERYAAVILRKKRGCHAGSVEFPYCPFTETV